MRKVIAILLLWVWPPLLMPQQAAMFGTNYNTGPLPPSPGTGCTTAATAASVNCTITAIGGETLIIGMSWNGTQTVTSVVDSAGTPLSVYAINSTTHPVLWFTSSARSYDLYYEANLSSGTHTITITLSSSVNQNLAVVPFTGAKLTSPIDAISTPFVGTNVNPLACNALTTTQTNDTIIAWGSSGSSSIVTNAGSGYTLLERPQNFIAMESGPAALATSYTPTFSSTSLTTSFCGAVAIKHI